MAHTPSLYALLLPNAAAVSALSGLNDGDWLYIQDASIAGYYTYFSGAPPVGAIVAPGGYLLQALTVSGSPFQHVYGGLYTHNGATPQTLAVTPAKLTCWNGNSHYYLVTDDLLNHQLVIQKAGVYQITLSLSGTAGGNKTYNLHPYKNASAIHGAGITRLGSASNPVGGTSVTFESFAIGDTVSVYGSVDATTGDLTVTEASLSAVMMG